MSTVVALDTLLHERRIWRGRTTPQPADGLPSGHDALDAALPGGGWPQAALSEILIPADGIGELRLLWPALARLSQGSAPVVLIAPPYQPCAQAWQAAGIDLRRLQLVHAGERDALWAMEQCLRSGSCAAVLGWPRQADDRALRRLQVAAESGHTPGFAYRPLAAARNPSPAALRLALDIRPAQLRVLKCRGALAPARPVPFALQ